MENIDELAVKHELLRRNVELGSSIVLKVNDNDLKEKATKLMKDSLDKLSTKLSDL